MPRLSRSTRVFALCASTVIALYACHDATAPQRDLPTDLHPSALLNSTGAVIVSHDSMHGWTFYDDQHSVACTNATVCDLVQGPAGTPIGSGSAELATSSSSDGPALILADYGGTRFDRITQLRYSTYRQSADAGNNLAIALQFNVDYDLNDQNASWQGRLVFEPYQSAGGSVTGNSWQSWDAKAGPWWGTKSTVPVNGVARTNPCVQATPCTWAQLLNTFPNVAVHATYGAVILKAGSGWASFRGNVDSLAIAVDGVPTLFDFEVSSTPPTARLRTRLGVGVDGARLPVDSMYALGSTVSYAFSAAPGHEVPIVVIDDTFVSASGTLVMDRAHTLEVEADSIYTLEGLSADGAVVAEKVSELLTAGDKPTAYLNIVQYLINRLDMGANPDTLEREADVAWALTADPVRDSAALAVVDDALDGYTLSLQPTEWGSTLVSWEAPTANPGATGKRTPSSLTGLLQALVRPLSASTVSRGALDPADQATPREPTVFIYVNGVRTDEVSDDGTGAIFTMRRLLQLVLTEPRFASPFVKFDYVLNKRAEVQLAEWDAAHPCVKVSMRQMWLHGQFRAALRYQRCMEDRNALGITMNDFVEAATARIQLILHLTPTNPDVARIAERIKMHRDQGEHAIMVGHSEGTVLIAQAVRSLPSLEGHPIQVAKSCVASLSVGTPADRRSFGLDDPYNTGFVVEGDIIQLAMPTGWDVIRTPATERMEAQVLQHPDEAARATYRLSLAAALHSIDNTYLRDPVARAEVLRRIVLLHKECVQQEITITPPSQTVLAGNEFTFTPRLFNQNGRELFGRDIYEGWGGDVIRIDKYRYRAHLPRDPAFGPQGVEVGTPYLYQNAEIVIPLVRVTGASLAEKDSSWWEMIASSNGGLGDPPYGFEQGPGYEWDGSPSSCGAIERIEGRTGWAGPSYGVFELYCMRLFTITQGVVTDPEVAPEVDHIETRFYGSVEGTVDPGQTSVSCGPEICLDSVEVIAIDRYGEKVGTSGTLAPGDSSPAPSRVSTRVRVSSHRVGKADTRSLPRARTHQ